MTFLLKEIIEYRAKGKEKLMSKLCRCEGSHQPVPNRTGVLVCRMCGKPFSL